MNELVLNPEPRTWNGNLGHWTKRGWREKQPGTLLRQFSRNPTVKNPAIKTTFSKRDDVKYLRRRSGPSRIFPDFPGKRKQGFIVIGQKGQKCWARPSLDATKANKSVKRILSNNTALLTAITASTAACSCCRNKGWFCHRDHSIHIKLECVHCLSNVCIQIGAEHEHTLS